jgi:hypothetical protein
MSAAKAGPSVPSVEVRDRKRNDAEILDLVEMSKDPNRHYRWVRVDRYNTSVVKHRLRGYVAEISTGGIETIAEPDKRGDGHIVVGDVMLMSCPRDLYEQRVADRLARQEATLASTSAETKRMAKEKGIALIQDTNDSL